MTKEEIDLKFEQKSIEIIAELLGYIESVKQTEPHNGILDIIMDFAHKRDMDMDEIGDVISTDFYLTEYIESQCIKEKFIRVESETDNSDW